MLDINNITLATANQLTADDISYLMNYPNPNGSGTFAHKLLLIKYYRAKTGKSWRASREAIEEALEGSDLAEFSCQTEKMQALFGKMAVPSNNEQWVATLLKKPSQSIEDRMKAAIAFAVDNWKVMGFASARLAAKTVLENFPEVS
jgi:hypothetical protein